MERVRVKQGEIEIVAKFRKTWINLLTIPQRAL